MKNISFAKAYFRNARLLFSRQKTRHAAVRDPLSKYLRGHARRRSLSTENFVQKVCELGTLIPADGVSAITTYLEKRGKNKQTDQYLEQ
ncbi:MAG: hypothetical protein KKA31_01975 [Candidatus Margulisbacteria bacterium]|nr:hypothetical protein [Candidatus Margulisiibacteriota bacterium]